MNELEIEYMQEGDMPEIWVMLENRDHGWRKTVKVFRSIEEIEYAIQILQKAIDDSNKG